MILLIKVGFSILIAAIIVLLMVCTMILYTFLVVHWSSILRGLSKAHEIVAVLASLFFACLLNPFVYLFEVLLLGMPVRHRDELSAHRRFFYVVSDIICEIIDDVEDCTRYIAAYLKGEEV